MKPELKSKRIPEATDQLDVARLLSELESVVRADGSPLGFGKIETGVASESSRFIGAIREVLGELGFLSVPLLELTIFDPKDRDDHRFYTIVEADSTRSLDVYQAEMARNVAQDSSVSASDRGPIIPNPDLYRSVLWWSQLSADQEAKVQVESSAERFRMVGSFSITSTSRQISGDSSALLEEYIESFVGRVAEELMHARQGETESCRCFMLVPFSRPSPRRRSEKRDLHRGGGLFIFGSLRRDNGGLTIDEQVLAIGTVLTRMLSDAVLRYSHTQLDTNRANSEGYQRALDAFSHQIRETAAGVGSNWLMEPSRWQSAVEAYSKNGAFSERLTSYQIAPAPELFEGLRTTLSLWAQSRKWQDLFLREQRPPENLSRLLEIAFDYARDLRFVAAFRNANFQDWAAQLPRVWERASLEFMNKKSHLRFETSENRIDPADIVLLPSPTQEGSAAHGAFFSDLCESLRLFVAAFDNYMGRGDVSAPIRVGVSLENYAEGRRLKLLLSNVRRAEESYGDANIWPGAKGKDVIHDLALRLDGRVVWPELSPSTKIFSLQIHLPLLPLWGVRGNYEALS